jgi:hypothetical protein
MADTPVKKTRAPRKKATAAAAETPSILAALGAAAPAIFVDEIEHVPVAPAKKSTTKKPTVVAVVTPDGIKGSLTATTEQRPLIAHLPIHTSDLYNEMFSTGTPAADDGATPKPFDAADGLMSFTDSTPVPPPPQQEPAAPAPCRPSLPLHYSEKLMVRFQDANRDQRLPDSTDVACFWDCHPFRGTACVIPTVIEEGVWRVYGNFCCPECAAAYLFNERLDSHVQWERYALLNRLYAATGEPVRIAPPRTVLRMFGGSMDVSDFRATLGEKRLRMDVLTPPMISIIQVMDTKPIDFYDASIKNNFIPWEMDRMNRPGAQGLRLRRTKPIADKETTLEHIMGIVTA